MINLAGVGPTGAAEPPPGSASARSAPGMMRAEQVDPVAATQKQLESLGKNLYLKPGQQSAWQAYVAAMTQMSRERGQEPAGRWQGRYQGSEDISTPDRLDRKIEQMRGAADRLAKVAGETRVFYSQLTPEQKTIFDLQSRHARHERLRQHKPAGAPR